MARPLPHPHIDDVTVAGILHALSDPARLCIVSKLLTSPGGMNCTETTHKLKLTMPKSTCSQHYRILREAGLLVFDLDGKLFDGSAPSNEIYALPRPMSGCGE